MLCIIIRRSVEFRPRIDSSPRTSIGKACGLLAQSVASGQAIKAPAKSPPTGNITSWKKQCLATFMDVATLRCLCIPNWDEEGVFWGVTFLLKRCVARNIRIYFCDLEFEI